VVDLVWVVEGVSFLNLGCGIEGKWKAGFWGGIGSQELHGLHSGVGWVCGFMGLSRGFVGLELD